MHELGIVFHIVEKLEKLAIEHSVDKIAQVTLEIGEVSTVVQDQFIDCWNWAIKRSNALNECELKIETIKAITYCEDCRHTYNTVEYGKTCPFCQSENTYLLRGNEVAIKSIGVKEN